MVKDSIPICNAHCMWNEDLRHGIVVDWYLENEWLPVKDYIDKGKEIIYAGCHYEIYIDGQIETWSCEPCYVKYVLLPKLKMGML